jgi:hypothetical protein
MQPTPKKSNDLFFTTLEQLHGPAPTDLLNTLRAQLHLIKKTNPNSAQTAEACLDGLVSDRSTLLHVLTAAYLINGGVMLKHQLTSEENEDSQNSPQKDLDFEFNDLQEELDKFSISMDASKRNPQDSQAPPPHPTPLQTPPRNLHPSPSPQPQ